MSSVRPLEALQHEHQPGRGGSLFCSSGTAAGGKFLSGHKLRMRSAAPPSPSPRPAPLPLSSSSLPLCPELDLSLPLSPAPKTSPTHPKPRPHREPQQLNPTHPKPRPHRQTEGKRHRQVRFEEPVVVTVTAEPSNPLSNEPQQPTRNQRRRGHRHGRVPGQRAGPPVAVANEEPGCLEGAELNTSLALKAELESLQGAEFNSQKAVQETLRKSERTKNLINTKATEGVNVSRSQLLYSSLVSVSVEEDQLISQALQDRLLLAPPPRNHDNKSVDAPSLLLFLTSDLQRQKPLPQEEEPIRSKPRPSPRPAHTTFDLYRRQTRWQAVP
uniref:protein phosphatase 1 regulatory subunit 35 n=1 Tax=Centroberyx gerrardi TaxID=166262 RepID=UPI003AADAC4E